VDDENETESEDSEIEEYKRQNRIPKNSWIIKPGENTNRGNGIEVLCTLGEIKAVIGRATKGERTFIIQKYIDYPLLVHRRKFDFRCFGLLTSIGGFLKGFAYEDGYVRTSCKEFNHDELSDRFVHLTNDAI
jgi:tubulin---tyrosine ligase